MSADHRQCHKFILTKIMSLIFYTVANERVSDAISSNFFDEDDDEAFRMSYSDSDGNRQF